MTTNVRLAVIGWILVLSGGWLAHAVQTSGGVVIDDVRIELGDGKRLSALLYRPPNATAQHPAPGILAVHGYINSRETQSGFAIEFARRGYVVLAIDQTGHGFSEGVAFSTGYGGPAALAYLRSLDFVDGANIGLEGHSMGGWTSLAAAADQPDGYRSIALVGSSTGPGFAPVGTPGFPRNLGVIFSRFDEFSELMWGVKDAADIGSSDKLKAVFGTLDDVVPERVYGSIDAGTARWLTIPNTTHPGDHLSTEAIGDAISWMGRTLTGGDTRVEADQIWYWKELGTLIALIGGACVLLGTFALILMVPLFRVLAQPPVEQGTASGSAGWTDLLVTTAVPALSYFPLTGIGAALTPNALFPQGITNQILLWALANGLFAIAFAAWRRRDRLAASEARFNAARVSLAALSALLSVCGLYLAVVVSDVLFKTDLRFWVVALKPMALHHVPTAFAYLLPFVAFFYASQWAWLQGLRSSTNTAGTYVSAITGNVLGLLLMVVGAYLWLLVAGHLPPVDPLFTIVAIQFVPVLALTSIICVFAFRRTGGIHAGALICGLLVTWYVVAGQATHV